MSTTPTAARPTQDEIIGSVTGFDEIAVAKHFDGINLYDEAPLYPMMLARALVFVHRMHGGEDPVAARKYALGLTVNEINDYFGDDADEVMPDEPTTDAGKDASPSVSEPESSPPSAS